MSGFHFATYLSVIAGVTYLVRALPFLIFRKRIENVFVLSVLYYAPYAILGAMTFPDILYSTGSLPAAGIGLVAAFLAAWKKLPMLVVAIMGSATAVAAQLMMR